MRPEDQANATHDEAVGSDVAESSTSARKRWEAGLNVGLDEVILDETRLDKEVALLVSQYLSSRSYGHIAKIIEEQILDRTGSQYEEEAREVEQAIHDGDFNALEALLARPGLLKPQSQKAFLYLCYRQQFLEHVENRESQKAFNLLSKRLKPLEHYQPIPYDFFSLSYLTSANTVHDAPSFRNWAGVDPERDVLIRKWRELIDADRSRAEVGLRDDDRQVVKPGRLMELFRQAGVWQVVNGRRGGKGPWKIASLLRDYRPMSIPTSLSRSMHAHQGGAKCVSILGSAASTAVTAGSDGLVKVIDTSNGSALHTLTGHTSRIWDVDCSLSGDLIASASGDGTVKLWSSNGDALSTLGGEGGDVYGVRFRPTHAAQPRYNAGTGADMASNGDGNSHQVTTASYDRIVRTYDVETSALIRTFSGHSLAALCVAYDPVGTLMASGAKDRQVRLWDAVGGVCVNTLSASLGEVTSVEFDLHGRYLLVGSKDNANRLWDLRMNRNLYRYTGHQNTAKNFIRCSFALDSRMIVGGSEDGNVYTWEREPTTEPAQPASSKSTVLAVNGNALAQYGQNNRARQMSAPAQRTGTSAPATNVSPYAILEAEQGHGAVFDVKERAGMMVCAWNDGHVGCWEDESDE